MLFSAALVSTFVASCYAQYSATYLPNNAPNQTQPGQEGYNQCGTKNSQDSMCQNSYINSVEDFCLYAPPQPGADAAIGNTERFEVSWCLKDGYGTRTIPPGTITGAHFVQTPDYVQVTGVGDLTKLNIPNGDAGGELDPHGADGNGNPIGGLVFSSAFGQLQQLHEWTNFMSFNQFCFRACKEGGNGPNLCNHVYDTQGCAFNIPGSYDAGVFENCKGDTDLPMGQPGAEQPAPTSMCTKVSAIGATPTSATSTPPPTHTSASASQTKAAAASNAAQGSVTEISLPLFSVTGVAVILSGLLGAFVTL